MCGPGLSGGIVDRRTPFETDEDTELNIGETDNETEETELRDIISSSWNSIKSFYKCHRIVDILNVRLWEPLKKEYDVNPLNTLKSVWDSGKWRTKINVSVGCILQHKETRQFRYFHSSSNSGTLFDQPQTVSSTQQLELFSEKVSSLDIEETAFRQRPNTQWRLFALTNMTFYVYKMPGVGRVGAGEGRKCPKIIQKNQNIIGLYSCNKTGRAYTDNLCFFRCLALMLNCRCKLERCTCKRPKERLVKSLFRKYLLETGKCPKNFSGVEGSELTMLERIFDVSITVFSLSTDGKASVKWNSGTKHAKRLNVNLHVHHFSYIKNVNAFCRAFSCNVCDAVFTRASSCRRHKCKVGDITDFTFKGGLFTPAESIFQEIERETGISVAVEDTLNPYRVTFDIEAMLPTQDLPSATETLTFESEHRLLSISVCSNVPCFTQPLCFVVDSDGASACVSKFVHYLKNISEAAAVLELKRHSSLIEKLTRFIQLRETLELAFADIPMCNPGTYRVRAGLSDLVGRLKDVLSTIPVVGFNCQRYDLNIMKGALMKELFGDKAAIEKGTFIVKRQDALTCIQTGNLRILDITNYISPGFSYSNYLKAYGVSEEKGFFPYEWLDCLEKLNETSLPPHSAFYSKLRRTNISEEEYAVVVRAWQDKKMKSVRDLLVWYNNLDVKPFLLALDSQSEIYKEKGIDMLTRAISLPGLAVLWMFNTIGDRPSLKEAFEKNKAGHSFFGAICAAVKETRRLHLIDEENHHLYKLFRENLVGGPSLVFHRYHEAGKTVLRPAEEGTKLCQEILGVDANALYLYCLMQDMPVGRPRIRLSKDNFAIKKTIGFGKTSQGWLAWVEFQTGNILETAICEGERRLGRQNVPVDGFAPATDTVYEFNGCYWHGHGCSSTTSVSIGGITAQQRFNKTALKRQYLEQLGYKVVSIWECDWRKEVNNTPAIKEFLQAFYRHTYGQNKEMTEDDILNAIKQGKMFGFVECDIRVPDNLVARFSEMPPIFKNVCLDREHLSEHMKQFAETEGYLKRPQRYLIGSLYGTKILLLTELLKWYLEQGLVVDKIYQVIEFEKAQILKPFGESVTAARRAGDTDVAQKLLASTAKLVGNSLYGKTIVDKTKHRNVSYTTDEEKAAMKIANRRFHSVNILDEDVFETVAFKKRVCVKLMFLGSVSHLVFNTF